MKDSSPLLIEHGCLLDPATRRERIADVYLAGGRIADRPEPLPPDCRRIDARGLVVVPGFWDLHVHLREPGDEAAETITSGSEAAARGGFTTIVAMPNTRPAIDIPERVADVLDKGRRAGFTHVLTTACITRGREGRTLAPLSELADAGAVAFTDDGSTVPSTSLMRRAMELARDLGRPILDHAQDPALERRGVMHDGPAARRFGLPGIPSQAESDIVRRDAELAEATGCPTHIQHVTAAASLPILADAQARGVPLTAELSPHHLALCDEDIDPDNASFKMNPPLRTAADRRALTRALLDGVLQVFATDHAPHTREAKERGFLHGPFGVLGLETAIGVTYTLLVQTGRMSPLDWVHCWTAAPARVLGREPPSLTIGRPADLALLDLHSPWRVDPEQFASRSRNTPFAGWDLRGRCLLTVCEGKITWAASR